jgi:hypothetical protein
MRERAVLEGLAAGDRTVPELVARIYRDLDARLVPGALLSTQAHLDDLVARQLVRTEAEPKRESRYWPAGAAGG